MISDANKDIEMVTRIILIPAANGLEFLNIKLNFSKHLSVEELNNKKYKIKEFNLSTPYDLTDIFNHLCWCFKIKNFKCFRWK